MKLGLYVHRASAIDWLL